jgi:carboxyl-terminal processing protease
VAKYQSPSGKKIEDEGVTPNVVVASAGDDDVFDEDSDTPAAPAPPVKKPAAIQVDEQLNKALELLKSKPA